MKNDIKEKQGSIAGQYEKVIDINGKPSYKKDDKGIWYNKDRWIIGLIADIGTERGYVYTRNINGGLIDEKNVWEYWNGNEWTTAGTNDITVKCTSGTLKFLR